MRRAFSLVAVLAVAIAGCDRTAIAPDAAAVQDAFTARAQQVAALWEGPVMQAWSTGFVPLDDLTIWSSSISDDATKLAAGNGWYTLDTALPEGAGQGVVRFEDGQTLSVPVVGPKEAYEALARPAQPICSTCASLVVTGVKLTTRKLMTSRGTATVPAWAFTIRTLADPMVRVAVAPQAIASMPRMTDLPLRPNMPLTAAGHLASTDGDRIEYTLRVSDCDKDLRALVWESDRLVVLGGTATEPDSFCSMGEVEKPVTATLSRPVGDRVLVDLLSGQAVFPR